MASRQSPKRADWSRLLPRPIVIPTVMTLRTLTDVRELLRHLPEDRRSRRPWRHVAAEIDKAAAGADTADISIALHPAMTIEGVEFK